ncbi:AraC family transcriptional regulator [Rugamonas rivuli]|uniref:Helix-turn-helix domain-containing protein n=1 Tax=Rugamonas rivuli TaxID=2743358 RepID=A0A843S2J6_9BURK|nr:helix-turn-helix domain-containing protein [Rugamonas rivuli]MQA18485.1 helix-turn-helix domain-containing protein [Rugamonas rivuli]
MQEFYKKALLALIFLVLADALLACALVYQSYLSLSLLPAKTDGARWHYGTYSDVVTGGSSTVRLPDASHERMRMDFVLTDKARYPFLSSELALDDDKGRPAFADWSKYSSVSLLAKCSPANSIFLVITNFDPSFSKIGKFETYRSPGSYFSCNEQGVPVSLDLNRLSQPEWWFDAMKLNLSQQAYKLDHVAKILFGTSSNSPRNVASYVEISELTLHGRDYRYLYALAVAIAASLAIFGIWFFRAHTRALIASLESKMKKDLPLVAYRQLTLEPYKDKEKASVLRFIATNYTNPELDLECVVNGTGANRNKVNEVLKTELDMTFTSYLNKLRLTEAARLLAEKNSAAVAEIAYSVGYANVSYFNKLFKEEYDCTPKAFRSVATQQLSNFQHPLRRPSRQTPRPDHLHFLQK